MIRAEIWYTEYETILGPRQITAEWKGKRHWPVSVSLELIPRLVNSPIKLIRVRDLDHMRRQSLFVRRDSLLGLAWGFGTWPLVKAWTAIRHSFWATCAHLKMLCGNPACAPSLSDITWPGRGTRHRRASWFSEEHLSAGE